MNLRNLSERFSKRFWAPFWMRFASMSPTGRMATRLAGALTPCYKGRRYLARLNVKGYIAPTAEIDCRRLSLGHHIFMGDRVTIYGPDDGEVSIGDRVFLHKDGTIEVGAGGRLIIGADTHIQPRCQLSAYKGLLTIGRNVQIGPNCQFYPYTHGTAIGHLIRLQPLITRGGIVIEDDAWISAGAIVLDGVRIGSGAVVGAGSVVTNDVPDNAIAAGIPARVVGMRDQQQTSDQPQPVAGLPVLDNISSISEAMSLHRKLP